MTSALRGRGGGPKIRRFCGQTLLKMRMKGGGGLKSPNFVDVINGSPLMTTTATDSDSDTEREIPTSAAAKPMSDRNEML